MLSGSPSEQKCFLCLASLGLKSLSPPVSAYRTTQLVASKTEKKVNPMKIFLITAFKKSFLHTISSDKYCFSWHVFYSKQIQVKMESHVLWQETVFIKFKPQCALLYVFVFLKSVLCIRMYKDVHLCAAAICAQVYVCFVHAPLHQTYL